MLSGDDGDDALYGNAGNDLLRGGLGSDALTGGTGKDLFYFAAADLTDGAVDTVLDGGISTNDLIRVDGVPYYKLGVSAIAGGARISFEGVDGFIDVKGIGNNPVVVATSQTVASDYTQLNADSRANVQINYVDFANSQIWSHYTEIYNAAGQMTGQFGRYDGNGGSWEFRYDPAGTEPTYDTRFSYFNAAGQLTQEVGTYDSQVSGNTRYIATFDPDNTQVFTSSITYYDASGRPTQAQAFYDDGKSGITTFDAANSQAFDYYTTYYDAQGRAEQTNGVYDGTDGSFLVQFDKDSSQPWQSLTVTYDQAGTVTQQWDTMDNGAIVYI